MLEMIKDTDKYLLVKPYTISVKNITNPIKECQYGCNFKSTKKLESYMLTVFKKKIYKHCFNDANKSLLLMYLLDDSYNLNLELVILNNKTNKIQRIKQK